MSINVVIVEDQMLVRTALKTILSDLKNISVVGEASTGEDALKIIRQLKPDIAMIDIDLPGIGGFEITQRLKRSNIDTKIIIITGYDNEIFANRMMKLGVAGYLTKSANLKEMGEAITTVYNGHKYISQNMVNQLALKTIIPRKSSLLAILNNRELEFTMLIAKGVKAKELAEKFHLSVKTINGYRTRIFKKLGIKSDVELTYLALEHGLILSELLENSDA